MGTAVSTRTASAAVVVVGALAVAQFVGPQVSPDAGTTTNVSSTEPVAAPVTPPTSTSTTVGDPANTPLTRGGPQELPTAAPSSSVARGHSSTSPSTRDHGRTARPVRPDSGRTGRGSVQPTINPTIASTATPSVADNPGSRRSDPCDPTMTTSSHDRRRRRLPLRLARPRRPPAVVIPPKPPAITPAALVRQTIASMSALLKHSNSKASSGSGLPRPTPCATATGTCGRSRWIWTARSLTFREIPRRFPAKSRFALLARVVSRFPWQRTPRWSPCVATATHGRFHGSPDNGADYRPNV